MKKIFLAILVAAFSMGFHFIRILESDAADILRKLNIPEPIARNCVFYSFSGLYLSYPDPAELKKTARSDRTAIVQKIGEFAQVFTRSAEFKKRYLEYRESMKPAPPQTPKSLAEQKQEQKENIQKAIRETEANMKSLPAETRESLKEVLPMLREQLKSLDDPGNPAYSRDMEEMIKQGYENEKKEYAEKLAKWEKDLPLTPENMIRGWLREFLNQTRDVDFNAKLITKGDKMVFVNDAYEQQSSNWKLCYRAGKETVEAGRLFASRWLKELDGGQ
jgi:hypothetical protein